MARVRLARSGARLSSILAAVLFFTQAAPAFAQGADPKALLADGDKAAKNKEWQKALDAYAAANKASPSLEALEGVANAHYQLKNDGEAIAAYTEWLSKYGQNVAPPRKKAAEARLKELSDRTGAVTLTVNEAGAQILVDDKPAGTSPLAQPLRMSAGPHRIRVTKDGFVPFDQTPNVIAGGTSTIAVTLEAASTKGRLSVKEKTGKPIRVIVDGVDQGDAPWSGEVEAGTHDVQGRSPSMSTAPEKVTIERGKTKDVELIASSTTAPVKITTSDGKGLIYIDDKLVGEGNFSADLPAGPHRVRVTREGYDPFEEEIVVKDKEPFTRGVTLKLSSKIETGQIQKQGRALEGLYGGFGLFGMILPGGNGSSPQKQCEGKRPAELNSCDVGGNSGAGLDGFIGYHWDPVGVELMAAGQYDQQTVKNEWNAASVDPGIGPDPARNEEFVFRRVGVMGVARIRVTFQTEKLRFTAAAGVGLSNRMMWMTRETTSRTDPSIPSDRVVTEDPLTYWSPVISIEPTIMYRLTQGVAIGLSLHMLMDSPRTFDSIPRSNREQTHFLGRSGLTTPAYELATGTQFYIGPAIGMMFGP